MTLDVARAAATGNDAQRAYSRYKLYKSKTRGLLYWRTKSAAACTDLETIITSLNALPARKSKKKTVQTPELELRTAELVKLAEAVSHACPPVDVLEGAVLIIQDIIAGREECAEWYSAQALVEGGRIEQENETHRYFILVLQRAFGVLEEARAKAAGKEAGPASGPGVEMQKCKKSKAKDDSLGSMFDFPDLEDLEEPALDPFGEAPPLISMVTSAETDQMNFKLENETEDSAFEVWCYLQDMADLKTSVKRARDDYRRGEISFLAANSLTKTAFGLLHRADEEFKNSGPLADTEFKTVISYIGLSYFARGSAVWMCPDPDRAAKEPRISDSHINVVELVCPVASRVLWTYEEKASDFCKLSQRSPKEQQQ